MYFVLEDFDYVAYKRLILFLEQVHCWSLCKFPVLSAVCFGRALSDLKHSHSGHSDWFFLETVLNIEPAVMDLTLLFHKLPNMKEILLIGFYQPNEELNRFLLNAQQEFKISIR